MSKHLLEMSLAEVKAAMEAAGEKSFRAAQLMDWVYKKGVTDPAAMTNLPAGLAATFPALTSRVAARRKSTDGAVKLLLELADGERIETVLIPTADRATACVSTQAGCGIRCAFCATGRDGFRRDLSAGEILEQLVHLRQTAARRITHVVFMGMGEPLLNLDALIVAIQSIIDLERFAISARHVTVSTVGIPKAIRRLAKENLPITLAISLHAPTDALRRQLVPLAATVQLEELLSAAEEFFRSRNREITLEYVLLAGINDTNVCAEGLANIAHRLRCNVNLIRYNHVDATDTFRRPAQPAVKAFADRLLRRGVNVHVRQSRGLDADAACGQLRQRTRDENQGAEAQGETD